MTFEEALAASAEVSIWTDGACHPNPGGYGGWACVFVLDGLRFELSGSEHPATNNRMELLAALRALEALGPERRKVTLTSDSLYVIRGVTTWIRGWISAGRLRFEAVNGVPVPRGSLPNVDLWGALVQAAAPHEIAWVHVRGHGKGETVCEENEACDRLAVAARKALRAEREGATA